MASVVVLVALVAAPAPAAPAAPVPASGPTAATASAEQQLAERYAPIVAVRTQKQACGSGEPYAPTQVEAVLGRDDVSLVGPDGSVVKRAPTAADLYGLGDGYSINLPGNPLKPRCDYEHWWDDVATTVQPTVYARVAEDPDHPGQLALQYWFYWVFNDFNDKHEGDWEMVQLLFDADNAEQALSGHPTETMYAQHEGGETKDWSDDALQRRGNHVVVYPAQGSHATYYASARWFGKSAQTGFGCDDTRGPHDVLHPAVVLLPSQVDDVTGADDPFAWLNYTGRWGQREPSFENGPTGPTTKTSWSHPVSWVDDEGRPSSVALPAVIGPAASFFCSATAAASLALIEVFDSPVQTAVFFLVIVVLVLLGVFRTRWRPSDPLPVAGQRQSGQLFVAALRLQGRFRRVFLPMSLVVLGGAFVAAALQATVLAFTPVGDAPSLADDRSGWAVPVALLVGVVVTVPVAAFVRAAAAAVVRDLGLGEGPTFAGAVRRAWRVPSGMLSALVVQVTAQLCALVPILVPLGFWLVATWGVATPAGISGDLSLRAALHRSRRLTRRHRVRTLLVTVIVTFGMVVVGPMLGTALLLLTDAPLGVVNLVSGLVGMVFVPWGGIVLALLHEDLVIAASAKGTTTGVRIAVPWHPRGSRARSTTWGKQ